MTTQWLVINAALLHRIAGYCRVSLAVLLVGIILLNVTSQGAEIAHGLAGDYMRQIYFFIAAAIWAWTTWYWSRLILLARQPALHKMMTEDPFDENDSPVKRTPTKTEQILYNHSPQAIGSLAFLIGAQAVWYAPGEQMDWLTLAFIAAGITSIVLWQWRWPAVQHDSQAVKHDLHQGAGFSKLLKTYGATVPVIVSICFAISAAVLAIIEPVSMGFTLGATTVAFVGLAAIAILGNLIVLLTHHIGFPVIWLMLILAIVLSAFGLNNNHAVRQIGTQVNTAEKFANRVTIPEAVSKWLEAEPDGVENTPLVLVATSGGGLRAAYWTGTVLGGARDLSPQFGHALFAISGVSGGSVGATVFNAIMAKGPATCEEDWLQFNDAYQLAQCFEGTAQAALAHDFLAPTLAAMFLSDLPQRFLAPAFMPSRATALERAWERAWDLTYVDKPEAQGQLADAFLQLWEGDEWLPLLMLNATHEESGKLIVASNLKLGVPGCENAQTFPDLLDIYAGDSTRGGAPLFLVSDMPASTAAHNSARFSYVSPAGTLRTGGHLIDGGYFGNYGAHALQELAEAVHYELSCQEGHAKRPIILVQISNDVNLADKLLDPTPAGLTFESTEVLHSESADSAQREAWLSQTGARANNLFLKEVLAPINGLLNVRESRGVLAAKELASFKDWFKHEEKRPSMYLHFRLFEDEEEPLALGWVLSPGSQNAIRGQLRNKPNARALSQLLCTLGVEPGTIGRALLNAATETQVQAFCEEVIESMAPTH
ncbi:MAG: hypothetical protein GKR94_20895 [Gammaproteobacteria bacterium]|nr:hypothetical protein [Gammaproteobacteria bacterium]